MATEKRLIVPSDLIAEITGMKVIDPWKKKRSLVERWVRNNGYDILITLVKHFPTVEAVEVVHGHWIQSEPGYKICSHCSADVAIFSGHRNYCPNCGAKMDGERKDNETG